MQDRVVVAPKRRYRASREAFQVRLLRTLKTAVRDPKLRLQKLLEFCEREEMKPAADFWHRQLTRIQ